MKRVLSVILSALFLLGTLPFVATAQTVASGECGAEGGNVVWTLDEAGTLTLSGSGKMKNYSWDGSPWYQDDSVTALKVEEGITSLGDYAFYDCALLEEVTLPESLTALGRYVFCGCAKLAAIAVPAAVKEIGAGAFYGCASLVDVNIPDGVDAVGSYTFSGCASLPEIALPEGITSIGGSAFSGCAALADPVFPDSLESIGSSAYFGCAGLSAIAFPARLTFVGKRAFSGCTGLTEIDFGTGLTSVGEEVFSGCTGLASLTLPENITSVGKGAFAGCAGLSSLNLSRRLTEIGEEAFADCTGLTVLDLPVHLASLGSGAFVRCNGLEEVKLPASLTTVEAEAFDGCDRLSGVIVPVGLVRIGENAFPAHAVLYGREGSFAEQWAKDNNRAFAAPEAANLTLVGPAIVSEPFVDVCGFTFPGAHVTCSLNGEALLTATAAASGKWNARIPLDGVADGSEVKLGAAVTAETTVTRELTTAYRSAAPAFRELALEHNGYSVTVSSDDLNTPKSNVTLSPELPFSFRVKVSNSDKLRKLYVVSTKKSDIRQIELLYDEASDCWLGSGFFDEADHSYTPGTLSVEGRTANGSVVKPGVSVKINFLKDPAGFAYEAVRSNPLADVTAAVYYKDEAGHELLWNAAAAEQHNPVPTPADGAFSWAVTRGTWQIRLSKDGYQTARTAWMTVPPAQDQVLLPMVTTQAPVVKNLNLYADRAEIVFSQYMEILSVNEDFILFDGYTGTYEPMDATETQEGSGVFYATAFRFTPDSPMAGTVHVVVSGARNYAGIAMASDYTADLAVTEEPVNFTATDAVALTYGETAEIAVSAENAAGKTVTVSRSGNITELSADTLTLDENGCAKLKVSGRMTGREMLTFTLDGTALTAVTEVTIAIPRTVIPGDVDNDGFVTPGDARLALRISVRLEDCEEGSETFLAADVNRDGVIGPDDARLILRASVGLEKLEEREPAPEEPQPATPTDAASPTDA